MVNEKYLYIKKYGKTYNPHVNILQVPLSKQPESLYAPLYE